MGYFDQQEFNNFVLDKGVIGFFPEPIKLKSGRFSNWYVNWRKVANDVYSIDELADHLLSFVDDSGLNPDCFYGVPEGATKLGIIAQYIWAQGNDSFGPGSHVLPMGRGKPKDHGDPKDRYFVGAPKGTTVVLEDVTTTGGSLLKTLDNLKENNTDVIAAIGLTNRMELRDDGTSVELAVNNAGVPYSAMSNALDLLPEAVKRLNPGKEIVDSIEREFKQYGVRELSLG